MTDTPGLWSDEQVRGWRIVTDSVHKKGGRIIAQLWHTGALSHPDLLGGDRPVSPSDVNPDLVARFAAGAPLADVQWDTVYASGPRGYIDYPEMEVAPAR